MTDVLRQALRLAIPAIEEYIKRRAPNPRDKREPRRDAKWKLEQRISALFVRRFRAQAELLRTYLQNTTGRKDWAGDNLFPEDEEFTAELLRLVTAGVIDGSDAFGLAINFDVDWTLTNAEAAAWARKYVGELIKDIDRTTLDAVRTAVQNFVQTPGMTLGDVMNALPFDPVRAEMIAVTEVTRAYAQGQKMAGETLKEKYPDVEVVKTWFTNNDDLVCPICAPLDGMTVPMDDDFPDIDMPPAHPRCRCWIDYRTNING